jgi:hypothetical protein
MAKSSPQKGWWVSSKGVVGLLKRGGGSPQKGWSVSSKGVVLPFAAIEEPGPPSEHADPLLVGIIRPIPTVGSTLGEGGAIAHRRAASPNR